MKKLLRNRLFIVLISMTLLFNLTACGNSNSDKIVGTWSVSSYKFQGKLCTQDDIIELFGSTFNDAYGQTTMVFGKDNTVDITAAGNNHHTGTYKLSDNVLSIYDSDELVTNLVYQNNSIELELPDVDVVIVFEKQ